MPLFMLCTSLPEIKGTAHNNTLAFWKTSGKETKTTSVHKANSLLLK